MLLSVLTIQSVKVPACLHVMIYQQSHRIHCLGIQLKPSWSIAAIHWDSLCSQAEAWENGSLSIAAQMSFNQEMTACTPVNKCIPWEAFLWLSWQLVFPSFYGKKKSKVFPTRKVLLSCSLVNKWDHSLKCLQKYDNRKKGKFKQRRRVNIRRSWFIQKTEVIIMTTRN